MVAPHLGGRHVCCAPGKCFGKQGWTDTFTHRHSKCVIITVPEEWGFRFVIGEDSSCIEQHGGVLIYVSQEFHLNQEWIFGLEKL